MCLRKTGCPLHGTGLHTTVLQDCHRFSEEHSGLILVLLRLHGHPFMMLARCMCACDCFVSEPVSRLLSLGLALRSL